MDRALFERLVREFREAGVEELGLFYLGESFLVEWLPDAIDFAKNEVKFPYVFLTTNGSLSSPDRVEACMRAGLDSLKFSLNWADEDQFKEVARVKKTLFATIISNVEQARRIRDDGGYDCGLYGSYIEFDGDQDGRMKSMLAKVRPWLDEIYALPLYTQAALVDVRDWRWTHGNRGRVGALRDPVPCWTVFSEGHVTFDGKLSACCFDHDGRFHMGDLTKQSFVDAWGSAEFQKLRARHLKRDLTDTPCETCIAYG